MKLGRFAKLAAGAAVIWLIALVILGAAYGGKRGRDIAARLGEALRAESTLGDSDLALIRGHLALDDLRVHRDDDVGKLALEIRELYCDLPPLGGALFDGECRELVLVGLLLDVSTFDLFKLKRPKRPPIHAGAVTIEDATLVFPTSVGRVQVELAEVIAGETTFKTPLSWLFALETLDATVTLPLGTARIRYQHNTLVITGSLFPKRPIVMPLVPPTAEASDDPKAELARITRWGTSMVKDIAKEYFRQALAR